MEKLRESWPRIIGMETEYGIHPNPQATAFYTSDMVARLPEEMGAQTNKCGFTTSGRIYVDQGKNIEACTPEVVSLDGLLAAHFAGEELAGEAATKLAGDDDVIFSAIKRTTDSLANSRGDHENFLVGTKFSTSKRAVLASHLATRIALTGPGIVYETAGEDGIEWNFGIDARGMYTSTVFDSAATSMTTPFMKSTKQPFDDRNHTDRLQVVCGSHNTFAYPIAARMLNTSSVIRLLEHDRYPAELTLDDPVTAVNILAADDTFTFPIKLQDGRTISAPALQYELMVAALELDLPEDERYVAELSAEIAADLSAGHDENWLTHLEWAAKRQILQRQAGKHDTEFPSAESAETDIRWHVLNSDSVSSKIRRRGMVAMLPNDDTVQAAKMAPPDKTRAAIRSEAIEQANAKGQMYRDIDWHRWTLDDSNRVVEIVNNAYGDMKFD